MRYLKIALAAAAIAVATGCAPKLIKWEHEEFCADPGGCIVIDTYTWLHSDGRIEVARKVASP